MKIKTILERNNNNLDIFRLVAACMVIYGHAYTLAREPGQGDFLGRVLHFDYSGSLAVKVFFFISGLVITNSLIERPEILRFILARVFRIWPGLLFVLFGSAFVIGPIASSLPLDEYLSRGQVYRYVVSNFFLQPDNGLPEVFLSNPYAYSINGSLWTLRFEVAFYMGVLCFVTLQANRYKIVVLIALLLLALDPLVDNQLIFFWRTPNSQVDLLAPCFAFGAFLAIMKEKIEISSKVIGGSMVLCAFFWSSRYCAYFFYISIFLILLYLSSTSVLLRIRPPYDISYGVYLWGFPVQQLLVSLYPSQGIFENQVITLFASILLGAISFLLIEGPAMAFQRSLFAKPHVQVGLRGKIIALLQRKNDGL
ncbi:MAG: acyltransferase [Chromatiaceae bacterium]